MSREVIQGKLGEVVRLEWRIWLTRSSATFVTAFAGIAACHFAIDWSLRPESAWRTVLLIVFLGALVVVGWREIWRRLKSFPTRDEIALEIERKFPDLDGRFISSHQLVGSTEGGSRSLIASLIDETARAMRALDFGIVPDRQVRNRRLGAALAAVLAWTAFVGLTHTGRMSFLVWVERLVNPLSMTEYPTKTAVAVRDGDRIVARGEDVELAARAIGLIPARASIVIQRGEKRPIEQPVSGHGRNFTFVQKAVLESFSYHWRLGDGRSKDYHVKVVVPPQVRGIRANYDYPAYTRRPPETVSGGNLEALPGTQATLFVNTNKPVDRGTLILEGGTTLPLNRFDATTLTTVLQIAEESSYRIRLVDEYGFENRDPMEYMIQPAADGIPRVELRDIDERTFVTPYGSLPIEIHARDDYGVTRVQLHLAMVGAEEETIEVPIRSNRTDVIVKPVLPLEPRGLEPGTEITLWASAFDNRETGGPQQGVSKTIRLEVVTPEDLLRLLREQMEALFPRVEGITQEAIESKTSVEDILHNSGAADEPTTGSR